MAQLILAISCKLLQMKIAVFLPLSWLNVRRIQAIMLLQHLLSMPQIKTYNFLKIQIRFIIYIYYCSQKTQTCWCHCVNSVALLPILLWRFLQAWSTVILLFPTSACHLKKGITSGGKRNKSLRYNECSSVPLNLGFIFCLEILQESEGCVLQDIQ